MNRSKPLEIKKSQIEGYGIHAGKQFNPGDIISDNFLLIRGKDNQGRLRIDQSEFARYTNHLDTPNATIVPGDDGKYLLVATKKIEPGEEVTVDYFKATQKLPQPFVYYYKNKPYDGSSSTGKRFDTSNYVKTAGLVKSAQAPLMFPPGQSTTMAGQTTDALPDLGLLTGLVGQFLRPILTMLLSGTAANRQMFLPQFGGLEGALLRYFPTVLSSQSPDSLKNEVGNQLFPAKSITELSRSQVAEFLRGLGFNVDNNSFLTSLFYNANFILPSALSFAGLPGASVIPKIIYGKKGDIGPMLSVMSESGRFISGEHGEPVTSLERYSQEVQKLLKKIYNDQYPFLSRAGGASAQEVGKAYRESFRKGLLNNRMTDDEKADRLGAVMQALKPATEIVKSGQATKQAMVPIPGLSAIMPAGVSNTNTEMGLDVLDKLTAGRLHALDPKELPQFVQELAGWMRRAPGGKKQLLTLLTQGIEAAVRNQLTPTQVGRFLPYTLAYEQTYRKFSRPEDIGVTGLTPDELAITDMKLRVAAASSPIGTLISALLAMEDDGVLPRKQHPYSKITEAIRDNSPNVAAQIAQNELMNLTPHTVMATLQQSNGLQPDTFTSYMNNRSAQEYAFKYNVPHFVRSFQYYFDVAPLLNRVAQGTVLSFIGRRLGHLFPGQDTTIAAQLSHIISNSLNNNNLFSGPNADSNKENSILRGTDSFRSGMLNHLTRQIADYFRNSGLEPLVGSVDHIARELAINVYNEWDNTISRKYPEYGNLYGLIFLHHPSVRREVGKPITYERSMAGIRNVLGEYSDDFFANIGDALRKGQTGIVNLLLRGLGAVPIPELTAAVSYGLQRSLPFLEKENLPTQQGLLKGFNQLVGQVSRTTANTGKNLLNSVMGRPDLPTDAERPSLETGASPLFPASDLPGDTRLKP